MRTLGLLALVALALACTNGTSITPFDESGETSAAAASSDKKVLFTDDFEDGDTEGWRLEGAGWSVETGAGNSVLSSSTGDHFAHATLDNPGWFDFHFHSSVRFVSGNIYCELRFRIDEEGQHYWLQVTDQSIALHREGAGAFVELARQELPILPDAWYDFEITAKGDKFNVGVNGSKVLSVKDNEPWGNPGTIGFEVHDNTHVQFDNVLVSRLRSKD